MEEENKNKIEISVLKGDKLFNENTPIIINITSPEPEIDDKKCSADLICIIDVSGSMGGEKIEMVKESLNILVNMMDKTDRLALVLFSSNAHIEFDLNYLTDDTKKELKNKISEVRAGGGTNILSGLEKAVDILKKEKNNTNENRVSSLLLLSDGCDNYNDDIQLAESLKKLTKGMGLCFTLNTFGYGYDHDPKIMNKLANIRDGSFFLVEDYKKVGEYFVIVLGGCVSVISKKVDLNVKLLNTEKLKIVKIFGEDNLYSYEIKPDYFKTTMLQFICGKEYTFVLEILLDESKVLIGEELIDIDFTYEDITQKTINTLKKKYKYELKDLQYPKANEEYIRSQVYDVLEKALKSRESSNNEESKKLLKDMEEWLKKNYTGEHKEYLQDIVKAQKLFEDEEVFMTRGVTYVTSQIRANQSKRTSDMNYCNSIQRHYGRTAQLPHKNLNNNI
jgi:Mg-chelatase subunit ChlD